MHMTVSSCPDETKIKSIRTKSESKFNLSCEPRGHHGPFILFYIGTMPPSSALPLKVTPASTPNKPFAKDNMRDQTPTPANGKKPAPANPGEISSPHELTAFVRTRPILLNDRVAQCLLWNVGRDFARAARHEVRRDVDADSRPQYVARYPVGVVGANMFKNFIVEQMSTRVDALEASIQDIINGDITTASVPASPAPVPGIRRSGSGLS